MGTQHEESASIGDSSAQSPPAAPQPRRASLFASLRGRLLLLTLVPLVPALMLAIYTAESQRQSEIARLNDQLTNLARLASSTQTSVIHSGQELVGALAQLPQIRSMDPAECATVLPTLRNLYTGYADFGVVGTDGVVTCSATPLSGTVSASHSLWFQRVVANKQFAVGEFQVGLITGEPGINVAQAILRDDGGLAGVIYATIPLSRFSTPANTLLLPGQASLLIVDRQGTVLTRNPPLADRPPGYKITGVVLEALEAGVDELSLQQATGPDGIQRDYRVTPIPGVPDRALYAIVGVPSSQISQDANFTLARNVGILLIVGLIATLAADRVTRRELRRPIAEVIAAARQIQSGNLRARSAVHSGPQEIVALSAAFDRMAAELQSQVRRTDSILNSAGEGIYGIDRDGRVTFINPVGAQILGYTPEELIGRNMHDAAHHSYANGRIMPRSACPEIESISSGTTHQVHQDAFWRKDGTSFPVAYTCTPKIDGETATGVVVVFRDITERLQAEVDRALRIASEREAQVKDELVGVVSHELRTPLAAIVGFSELILTRNPPEAQRQLYLETMLKEGRRLTALINDFLDLQRIESGAQQLAPAPSDLRELLQAAINNAGEDELRPIKLDLPAELPFVMADRDRILQVMANLLSNARKYSPDGGQITVTASPTSDHVKIAVTDQGLGIPPEAIPQLFQRFFRVDNSDRRQIKGTGLGLRIVKNIIEGHGGEVRAESPGLGQGSTMIFSLPIGLGSTTPEQVKDTPLSSARPKGRRVLVVEDDPSYASWIAQTLRAEGCIVTITADADTALQAAVASPPALVILDLRLADGGDGWDLLAWLRTHPETREVPVVIVSGHDERARGHALKVDDYVLKSAGTLPLLNAIKRFVSPTANKLLVIEDDLSTREFVGHAVAELGLEIIAVGTGAQALAALDDADSIAAIILDLGLPDIDGLDLLDDIRTREGERSIPVIIYTARDLTQEQKRNLAQKAAEAVRKGNGLPVQIAVARALGMANSG